MSEKQLLLQIDEFIAKNQVAIVQDIARLVAYPSVQGSPTPHAPFGQELCNTLNAALGIASGFGLSTNYGDGYVGWAQLAGKESGYIASITHLDVVPAGEGWDADPFVLRQNQGWLLGRGVSDDKGPTVLCLYAAKFFKEIAFPLRYGLRVLLGCSEESGMGDLPYYFANNPQPLFAFSPDAQFPVCNGEKGNFGGHFVSAPLRGNLAQFSAGLAFNVIPASASCLIKTKTAALVNSAAVSVQPQANGLVRLTARGVGGHSAHPQGTVNAIGLLICYILDNKLCSPQETAFLQLLQKVHVSPYGTALGIQCKDDIFNELTLNGGLVWKEKGRVYQSVDIRYPTATSGALLQKQLQAMAAACGASFVQTRCDEPFYIPEETPAIQVLLGAYNDISGKNGKAFTMGGGTYARHFTCGVSFGPANKSQALPPFAGAEHSANEGANLQELLTALKIYILAIARLQKLDF